MAQPAQQFPLLATRHLGRYAAAQWETMFGVPRALCILSAYDRRFYDIDRSL